MHSETQIFVRFIDDPENVDSEFRTAVGFDEPFVDMSTAEILAELKEVAGYPVVYYWERGDELFVYQPDPDELEAREDEERQMRELEAEARARGL